MSERNSSLRIFHNCKLYNGTETEVGKIGVAVNEEFQKLQDDPLFLIRKEELSRKNEMLSNPIKVRMMLEELESKHRSKKEKKSKSEKVKKSKKDKKSKENSKSSKISKDSKT